MIGVKCAHEPCTCAVEIGERYCSAACREEAARGAPGEMRAVCHCRHDACESR